MTLIAACWQQIGGWLRDRPIQFTGYLLGTLIVTVALGIALVQSNENTDKLNKINQRLCNAPHQGPTLNVEQCQVLLDKLLQHPTDKQVRRLRQIVKEGK